MITEIIPIVIPYLASQAQGRELEYAVAGWRRHFEQPHHIFIIGDYHPVVSTGDDITFIACPRVEEIPGQYRPHLDHVNKFRTFMRLHPEYDGFIYACDDMYAVNDFGMPEVLLPKIIAMDMGGDPNSDNGWQRDCFKTRAYCISHDLPIMNWVCHLPVYYDRRMLTSIYDALDCDHVSYVVENIYFNTFYKDRKPLKLDIRYDNLKCGVYRPNPNLDVIRKAFETKVWITNSVKGWIPELDWMLNRYYFRREK